METSQILAIVVAVLLISSIFMIWKMKREEPVSEVPIIIPSEEEEIEHLTPSSPALTDNYSARLSNKLSLNKNKNTKTFSVPLMDKNISPVSAASAMTYRHRNIDKTPIIPGRDSPRALLAKTGSNLVKPVIPAIDSVADTVITDMVNESIRQSN